MSLTLGEPGSGVQRDLCPTTGETPTWARYVPRMTVRHPTEPRPGRAVARFMAGSLAAIAVVVIGGFFTLRAVTVDEAERDTRARVQLEARLVESAGLSDGILREDHRALARLDDLVQGQILGGPVVRVKVWSRAGRILYSDEGELIGRRFSLGSDELQLFDTGGAQAELSDLSQPENRFERQEGKLLEAHTIIRTPNGTQVLFETYQRFGSVNASASRLLRTLAPPLLGGLAVLILFQLPLAWTMARRLQRGHAEREALLTSAVEASSQERSRIAADLHDGVVQDVAGVAFGLAPLAEEAARDGRTDDAATLREAIARLRHGVRGLRTLLVQLHPPSLESAGLQAALSDLLSPLDAQGVRTSLHVDDGAAAGSPADVLVYRVAREALRNVQAHSGAASVEIHVTGNGSGGRRLRIRDDGRGFSAADRDEHAADGHVGLALLQRLVAQADGTLEIHSAPGEGTIVDLEVPAP
jgi:two-component system NarL family sensor kinase